MNLWKFTGRTRPEWAEPTVEGQESVWDYPRPPRLTDDGRLVVICDADVEVVRSARAKRVCETASPPTWYFPRQDIAMHLLVTVPGESHCEWKGTARYYALARDPNGQTVAWDYPEPNAAFSALHDYLGFYPERLRCTVAGARVTGQGGPFYAGWVTSEIVGPWKGERGTEHW